MKAYKLKHIEINRTPNFYKTGKDKLRINLKFDSITDISEITMKELNEFIINALDIIQFENITSNESKP